MDLAVYAKSSSSSYLVTGLSCICLTSVIIIFHFKLVVLLMGFNTAASLLFSHDLVC